MAVHTFSTNEQRDPKGADTVQRLRTYCRKYGKNFSYIVVQALIDWENKQNETASVSKTR